VVTRICTREAKVDENALRWVGISASGDMGIIPDMRHLCEVMGSEERRES
jgi:hypothetical protein